MFAMDPDADRPRPRPEADYLRPEYIAAAYDVSTAAVRKWIVAGVRCQGQQVKLRALRVGRCWRIPRDAWTEFLAVLNGGSVETVDDQRDRRRAQREAERRLDERLGRVGEKKGRLKREG